MAVTQTDLDNLQAAIASGVRSATVGGQTVTYNTAASLMAAYDRLLAQFNAQNGVRGRRRQSYATYAGRGYDNGRG